MRNVHSLDYITLNTHIMDKAGWEKTVNKMINAMGAPLRIAIKRLSLIIWLIIMGGSYVVEFERERK